MKSVSAKELRHRTAAVLDHVRRGHEVLVTYRGRSVAVLAPLNKPGTGRLDPIGFGMWRARKDLRNVQRWLRAIRAPRHER